MNHPTCLALAAALIAGCAPRANAPVPSTAPEAAAFTRSTLDPDAAAARALGVSPRVRAAAMRLDAAEQRAQSAAVPPDPSIAIGLGLPIDGMGGTAVSLSIMQGIGWFLAGDAIRDAAARERDLAARELLAASVDTAAEARRLVRGLAAARVASSAARLGSEARDERLAIERRRLDLGESSPAATLALEGQAFEARALAIDAELEEHELTVALASLLALRELPELDRTDAEHTPDPSATTDSLEVIRARAVLARAQAALAAADTPLGADSRAGGGFNRDLEDRESVGGTLEFSVPLFRRGHDLAALRDEAAAAAADLAEAERMAAVENDHALARVKSAREAAEFARRSMRSALNARSIVENSLAEGEASPAEVAEARMREADAAIQSAKRRRELADALARLEARSTATVLTESPR